MLIERPDSRYTAENLAAIDNYTVATLDEAASKMAFHVREDMALTAEWRAADDRTQDELMRRVRARRR